MNISHASSIRQPKSKFPTDEKMVNNNGSDLKMRNLQNDTDLLLEENTEMMSVLNDLGELEDLTELYGDKDDIL
jgi:hypothetical protein